MFSCVIAGAVSRSVLRSIIRCERFAAVWMSVERRSRKDVYAKAGRHINYARRLPRALLLRLFISIPGERMLIEQLNWSWLFRWFVSRWAPGKPVWNHAAFSKNGKCLLTCEVAHSCVISTKRRNVSDVLGVALAADELLYVRRLSLYCSRFLLATGMG